METLTEEALGCIPSTLSSANGPDGDVELNDEDKDDENNTEPRPIDATQSPERQLVGGVALDLPSSSESDVAKADGKPSEQGGETRQGQEPVDYKAVRQSDRDWGKKDATYTPCHQQTQR